MRSFHSFLTESKRKKKLNGIGFMSMQDFVTESLMEAAPFLGATTRPFPEKELKSYLQRIVTKTKGSKEKYDLPYVHGGNIVITGETGQEFDLNALRAQITKRPDTLLKQNEKMKHSDGTATQFFNIGLPALKGLAINEKTGEFVIVDTCPGAGACKVYCYAMKGGYVQWKASSMAQTRILNFLMNDPDGFAAMLNKEISAAETKFGKKNTKLVIRWHDAGDFFSPDYLDLAYGIAKQHPTVDFYAYTKIASVAMSEKPENFLINFSAGAQPSQEKAIDFTKQKNSRVVPKELFKDLLTREPLHDPNLIQIGKKAKEKASLRFKNQEALDLFKRRLAEKYRIAESSILSYEEMQALKPGTVPKWNVIVLPGQGDESAARKDVLSTLLVFH